MNIELRRFIHSIISIPHLEAILLMNQGADDLWDDHIIARRLYLSPDIASKVLHDLCASGICRELDGQSGQFIFAPAFAELQTLIDDLAHYYSRNLIEVTNMIHARTQFDWRVQQFADAFKLNKDK